MGINFEAIKFIFVIFFVDSIDLIDMAKGQVAFKVFLNSSKIWEISDLEINSLSWSFINLNSLLIRLNQIMIEFKSNKKKLYLRYDRILHLQF